ncbi:hypothetical protein A6302_01723 [Methylobrevis pamukkalensis]|uniref:Uncharacterized protein n=2 Tax=Methylobrevis pamukkalensis TaxID=1439726 RepID=A0A1E3H607_9HYPH|nr:hypothetical protein A6302_01723 [Methylobrevis pamukkalensis]
MEIEAQAPGDLDLSIGRLAAANIHPETRLATDYLNHFNEVVMLIDMLPMMPECLGDVLAWRPRSYVEHFRASKFKERDLAIAAYDTVNPDRRAALENTVRMVELALASVQRMIESSEAPMAETIERVGFVAEHQIRPLLEHASGLINGGPVSAPEPDDAHGAQTVIDALFD